MSEQPGPRAVDEDEARQPTSHERHANQPWDASYVDGRAPWDIGGPQPAIVRLAGEGDAFSGTVLDAGCGTGEHALYIAGLGLKVLGVDVAPTAVSIAREKAAARAVEAEFVVADALHLDRLDRVFETVVDCGLFHTFDAQERSAYVASLASVTRPGAKLHVLCFRAADPDVAGPHPIAEHELREAFTPGSGWTIASIKRERIQASFAPDGAPAWLAALERLDEGATRAA